MKLQFDTIPKICIWVSETPFDCSEYSKKLRLKNKDKHIQRLKNFSEFALTKLLKEL